MRDDRGECRSLTAQHMLVHGKRVCDCLRKAARECY
jgi:hypothetical protein